MNFFNVLIFFFCKTRKEKTNKTSIKNSKKAKNPLPANRDLLFPLLINVITPQAEANVPANQCYYDSVSFHAGYAWNCRGFWFLVRFVSRIVIHLIDQDFILEFFRNCGFSRYVVVAVEIMIYLRRKPQWRYVHDLFC